MDSLNALHGPLRSIALTETEMRRTPMGRALLILASAQLSVAGCSTPDRLPAVPSASALRTVQGLGPIRFLVSRETDSFAAEARSALAKEQAWLASNGKT